MRNHPDRSTDGDDAENQEEYFAGDTIAPGDRFTRHDVDPRQAGQTPNHTQNLGSTPTPANQQVEGDDHGKALYVGQDSIHGDESKRLPATGYSKGPLTPDIGGEHTIITL